MAMAIETSIVRFVGTGAEVTDGTLWNLKAPLGSTFYAADINHRYVYDGTSWSPLTPEAAAGAEHQVQLMIAILAELKELREKINKLG